MAALLWLTIAAGFLYGIASGARALEEQVNMSIHALQLSDGAAPEHAAINDQRCNIFAFWNYPHGPPPFVQLILETWRHHTHGLCKEPILLRPSNVKTYIPDLPDEYAKVYPQAQSDLVRYAVLHHHGGIYLDTDVLVAQDLAPIISEIDNYDLISYETEGQNCTALGSFSSNIMAGRKGSKLHGAIWEAQKTALAKLCSNSSKGCHVAWAQLGERVSHKVLHGMQQAAAEPSAKPRVLCYGGRDSFVPRNFLENLMNKKQLYSSLQEWEKLREPAPLDRRMYHMFNSAVKGLNKLRRDELLDASTLVGRLFQQSLGS
eukprot:TRINITY_DN96586_c0_g1_i1.p1 TRINITY_DN96586_c0_g1~~TRINITY_DN96586_c0_g1_i1.p1  ORF type:complete len:318 (-),score=56.43 TRINITY_DN96586_c0_g1_i1:51-1004(-)